MFGWVVVLVCVVVCVLLLKHVFNDDNWELYYR
ncbi:hypothetical protein [Caulobacter phage ERS]|uniref:Uncharacterized protein n=1 Tax=Caulobacter phage ERS TaxID=3020392 RepID=A0AAF0B765_9CAUD|nr:hypothetical protein [Caulobacter phage ERS]